MDEAVIEAAARTVIPEDAVSVAGEKEGNGDVGVVLREVDGFAAIVPDTCLMLAQAVESFLGVPHIDEALGVIGLLTVDFGWRECARVFLGEFMAGGVEENNGAVGAGDFDL